MKWKIEFGSCPLEKPSQELLGIQQAQKNWETCPWKVPERKIWYFFLIQWHANPQMWNRRFSWSHSEALLCLGHSDDLQRLGHCGISIEEEKKLNRQIFITDRKKQKKNGWTRQSNAHWCSHHLVSVKTSAKRCETRPKFCKSMFMHLTKLSRIFAQLWGDRQSQWGRSGAVTFTLTKNDMLYYIIIYIYYIYVLNLYIINDFI